MNKYIYEMVTLSCWGDDASRGFYIDHHFEDYFLSKKKALSFIKGYMEWLVKERLIEYFELYENISATGSMMCKYRTFDGKKFEFYGIVRNIIL